MWSILLYRFCDQFNMDYITNTNLDFGKTPAQCEILRQVVGDSLANIYRYYLTMGLDDQALFRKIREEVEESSIQGIKNNLSENNTVKPKFPDPRKLSNAYCDTNIFTENKDSGRCTNEAISREFRNMRSPNFGIQVNSKYEHKYDVDPSAHINLKAYMEMILLISKYQKEIVECYSENTQEYLDCNFASYHAEKYGKFNGKESQQQNEGSAVKVNFPYLGERLKLSRKRKAEALLGC